MKEITIPILNDEYKVFLVFGKPKKAQKILDKHGYKLYDLVVASKGNRGLCYCEGKHPPVIWMPHRLKTQDEFGTLAHEAVHAIAHIFRLIHQSQDTAGEVFAHSIEAVIRGVSQKQ